MPGTDAAFAAFVATHEERLVRSLVSEAGLSRAAAAAVAADVLPVAFGRDLATSGAAYGWLRVAARHRAAGSADWAGAADAALVQALPAAAALAALPAEDRELLRLRFAEGVPAEEIAARIGAPVAEVTSRLDAAVAATALALPRRRLPVSIPRLAAAAAVVAAAVVIAGAPDSGNGARRPLADGPSPAWRVAAPAEVLPPEAATPGTLPVRTVVPLPGPAAVVVAGVPGDDDPASPPSTPCRTCGKNGPAAGLHVYLPADGGQDVYLGAPPKELDDRVAVCEAFPSFDTVVSCVPRDT